VQLLTPFTTDTDAQRLAYIRTGLARCLELGLTSVQTNDAHSWHLYSQLANRDELPLRVFLTIDHAEMGMAGRPKPNQSVGEVCCVGLCCVVCSFLAPVMVY
jgi:hypothetical protein